MGQTIPEGTSPPYREQQRMRKERNRKKNSIQHQSPIKRNAEPENEQQYLRLLEAWLQSEEVDLLNTDVFSALD